MWLPLLLPVLLETPQLLLLARNAALPARLQIRPRLVVRLARCPHNVLFRMLPTLSLLVPVRRERRAPRYSLPRPTLPPLMHWLLHRVPPRPFARLAPRWRTVLPVTVWLFLLIVRLHRRRKRRVLLRPVLLAPQNVLLPVRPPRMPLSLLPILLLLPPFMAMYPLPPTVPQEDVPFSNRGTSFCDICVVKLAASSSL